MSSPQSSPLVAMLRGRLAALPQVTETTSRFGARKRLAWRAGGREIAHLHSDTVVDIRLPATERRPVAHDSRLLARASRSDWVEWQLTSPRDTEFIADLIARAARAQR